MIWTECPRCEGEVGNWCGGQCHNGGLYICEHCGNAEEENSEECPCCGKPDEDMRDERLKAEADEGNAESAAELYAILSGAMDKAACRAAFLAGAKYAHGSANPDLLEALDQIAKLYEKPESSNYEMAFRAYDMRCIARSAIAKAEGGAS